MREFSKKGISDVVTTVLIILLVLAAVVIVWSFIRPQLDNTGTAIDAKTKCINVGAEAVSCNTTARAVTYEISGNDAVGVKFVVINGSITDSTQSDGSVNPVETFQLPAGYTTITRASVAAVVKDKTGANYTCDASPAVTCV